MTELFHYCGNDAFISIIRNKEIWLSSLLASNDALEGKVVFKLLEKLSRENGLSEKVIEELNRRYFYFQELIDTLGLCLSEEGDLLSQWRGYANDGKGFSIGFNKNYLKKWANITTHKESKLIMSIDKVIYKFDDQIELVRPLFDKILEGIYKGLLDEISFGSFFSPKTDKEIELEREKFLKNHRIMYMKIFSVVGMMYLLKNEAFKEEKEWRLKTVYLKLENTKSLFRSKADRIVPYEKVKFPKLDEKIINKIYIGPKNKTPIHIIKSLLHNYGFKDVEVEVSAASYR
ncbi:MAG: DUF2971 domain-containing protein [Spirochaetia bacterium]|jgi:hypothetical protein|nr:DUF2971 domain-containing protein [Spirochaetia bacterium]